MNERDELERDPVGLFLELHHTQEHELRIPAARLIAEMRDPPALRRENHLEIMLAAEAYLRVCAEEDLASLQLILGRATEPAGAGEPRTAKATAARVRAKADKIAQAIEMRASGMRWKDIEKALDRDPQTLQRGIREVRRVRGSSSPRT